VPNKVNLSSVLNIFLLSNPTPEEINAFEIAKYAYFYKSVAEEISQIIWYHFSKEVDEKRRLDSKLKASKILHELLNKYGINVQKLRDMMRLHESVDFNEMISLFQAFKVIPYEITSKMDALKGLADYLEQCEKDIILKKSIADLNAEDEKIATLRVGLNTLTDKIRMVEDANKVREINYKSPYADQLMKCVSRWPAR
jgi:hypothetical protein